ncbi:LuxR family transcriptional regulator [Knoellia sinensis KCTC 19936]|uniref:LuxR family transcriptional regulator n=1 Tax=Knoellia sinensis KCTC 19936 TaxID=1385520 RepID=A0A0A0IZB7_9MICO|nr:response regulator transcription factor [Knoellia sinensis]KGN29829.1 LuxR family transcriptional regulator [Knoellia sinensis KCTC 19936]
MSVTLTLADDEPLVRSGLRMVLEGDPALEILGEAGDGVEALAMVRRLRPDVALLDIRMPGLTGIEVTERLAADPDLSATRVLVLTTFADDDYLVAAARAGASGYLLKSMTPESIRAAVHGVARGDMTLAPSLVARLVSEFSGARVSRDAQLDKLTGREVDVLEAIAQGRSNHEIATSLFVSEGTVKTHVAAILRKLGLRDRTQAAVAAYELGLVRPGRS